MTQTSPDAVKFSKYTRVMPPKPSETTRTLALNSSKRKGHPSSSNNEPNQHATHSAKRAKSSRTWDARVVITQKGDTALNNGELDLQSFLRSREFEIRALQDGMERSKNSRTTRAFQEVPRDLRRRTASHNVKRVPKRIRARAAREMKDDNTPTITSNRRRPGGPRGRIRAETAKRLGILAKAKRDKISPKHDGNIGTRAARPKIRKDTLNEPPKPKSKFRKRQIHKTWLPTHMWLAKRAKMTDPKKPLWRFAIPITSTEKSYRPTHRASGSKGAVAWDMSYMSTIGLEGSAASLEKVLRAVGVNEQSMWEHKGMKWREGKRSWSGWLSRDIGSMSTPIGPSTIIWCPYTGALLQSESEDKPQKPLRRRLLVRIHPAAFLETWTELLRLSKLQRPSVQLEDLRFEIGSIEITGPGSTEALLGILQPYNPNELLKEKHAEAFESLAGLTNPASLPTDSLLSFSIMDPRLRYPPRPVKLPRTDDEEAKFQLLEILSAWPVDLSTGSVAIFDRDARFQATRLPSQKALNRRKSLATPGSYATLTKTDPAIPIVLMASRATLSPSSQGRWTLLAPWKCILPIWYGLVHYPLSSGGNPRFGGVDELRQTYFERGMPWFPADYPGTLSGFSWELEQRDIRKAEWNRRPKGKRIEWGSLDLGTGKKGEVGCGWACDIEHLFGLETSPVDEVSGEVDHTPQDTKQPNRNCIEAPVTQLSSKNFTSLISSSEGVAPNPSIATVSITLLSRGIAKSCARIYRLPASRDAQEPLEKHRAPSGCTREDWLALLPAASKSKPTPKPTRQELQTRGRIPLNVPLKQRVMLLAQSLLQDPPLPYPLDQQDHPIVPSEEDLIGFVTTGSFNLAEGKGVAIGSVSVPKVLEDIGRTGKKGAGEGRLCIIRNTGEKIGRLARWEPVM